MKRNRNFGRPYLQFVLHKELRLYPEELIEIEAGMDDEVEDWSDWEDKVEQERKRQEASEARFRRPKHASSRLKRELDGERRAWDWMEDDNDRQVDKMLGTSYSSEKTEQDRIIERFCSFFRDDDD